MATDDPIEVVAADPAWAGEFQAIGHRLREALGRAAVRIDHVGSTAVPGLDAKPVIDIQVSVDRLDPDEPFRLPLERLAFRFQSTNPDRSKRFYREPPGSRRTHVHVRRVGSVDEQLTLLFRDFLRASAAARREYAAAKHELARTYHHDREGYVRAKEPTVWALLRQAHDWMEATGWTPGPTDL